jgi:hypothetical protein
MADAGAGRTKRRTSGGAEPTKGSPDVSHAGDIAARRLVSLLVSFTYVRRRPLAAAVEPFGQVKDGGDCR